MKSMYEIDLNSTHFAGQTSDEFLWIDIFFYRQKYRGFSTFVLLPIERYGGGLRVLLFSFLNGLFYAYTDRFFY